MRDEKFEAAYLLGMGGSSLCAEVLRSVFGIADGYPELHVLDTTDELTLTTAAARMDPARTLFIVASKSGGTVEVASMERFFWEHMTAALGADAGRHFVAITDPGTALQSLAETRRYREVFINPPDIGGRFSALSLFGLVPAAVIGAPVDALLAGGAAMAEGCRQHNHANAGLELGAFIAAAALDGRDKLTVALAPSFAALGLWIEQLVAESTGKHGKGSLPVVDEPLGRPDEYGNDRVFVAVASESDAPDEERLKALEAAGHPVLRLSMRHDGLGAEFFRWEFATAVAGAALGLNPFDEPNVSEAKDKTKALLAGYAAKGRFDDLPGAPSADAVAPDARLHPSGRLRRVPLVSSGRNRRREHGCGDPEGVASADQGGEHLRLRSAVPALDRSVSQGRAEHVRRLRAHRRRRDRDTDPGGRLFVLSAEARTGARRRAGTRGARPPGAAAALQEREHRRGGAGAVVHRRDGIGALR